MTETAFKEYKGLDSYESSLETIKQNILTLEQQYSVSSSNKFYFDSIQRIRSSIDLEIEILRLKKESI